MDDSKVLFKKKIICKYCEVEKQAYCTGLYPNSKDKKFVDKDGKQFNGKTCPSCQVLRMKLRQRQVRSTKSNSESQSS